MTKDKKRVCILILLIMFFQVCLYFLAKFSPISTYSLDTTFDKNIPFIPCFVYFYIIWYIMLFVVPFVIFKYSKNKFLKYMTAWFISIIICFIIYFIFPTTMVREDLIVNNLSTYLISKIYYLDEPVLNCLPSMHCLISFLFIFVTIGLKDMSLFKKIIIISLSVLIILSTLFIKQHVLIDAVIAFVIAVLVYICVLVFKIYEKISFNKFIN